MDCHLFKLLMQRYYDGELDAVSVSEYERHRRACEVCGKLDAEYAALFAALGSIPLIGPSDSFNAKVLARVDVSRYRVSVGRRAIGAFGGVWSHVPAPARTGGVVAIVFALFVSAYRPLLDLLIGILRGAAAIIGSVMLFTGELPGMSRHLLKYFSAVENYKLAGATILKALQRVALELHITYIVMAIVAFVLLLCIVRIARIAARKGETHASIF